ncbi:MAG TPA: response regulator transcription factor [Burkholderiaceae bacterium]|nr:response regulator transcription factor [Burkholderiaceae bacterium]
MSTLLLVDDHALFRAALTSVLEHLSPDLKVAHAPDLESAFRHCQCMGLPDLVLLDLGLPDAQGAEAVKTCLSTLPDVPVVMLSATTDSELVQRGLAAGAKAFIHKSDEPQRMLAALTPWLPDVAQPPSPRQMEVLDCLCRGLTTSKAIARELGLSEYTVRQHLAEVFRKLGVHNRAQAMVAAQRWLALVGAPVPREVSTPLGDDPQG